MDEEGIPMLVTMSQFKNGDQSSNNGSLPIHRYNWWYIMVASMGGWIHILIWRTGTKEQWHSHGMQYHNWCSIESRGVHNCMDSMTKSENLWGTISSIRYCRYTKAWHWGASKHCHQCNLEITRDVKLYGSHNRLTNMLESGDNWGIRPNNVRTNTLYGSQWCDDVAEVKHVRHNQPKRN